MALAALPVQVLIRLALKAATQVLAALLPLMAALVALYPPVAVAVAGNYPLVLPPLRGDLSFKQMKVEERSSRGVVVEQLLLRTSTMPSFMAAAGVMELLRQDLGVAASGVAAAAVAVMLLQQPERHRLAAMEALAAQQVRQERNPAAAGVVAQPLQVLVPLAV